MIGTRGGIGGKTASVVPAIVGALAALFVAFLGASLTDTGPWYQGLAKPAWTPPDAAFGLIWTLIFAGWAAAAVAAWRSARTHREAEAIAGLFAFNGFLNILWSLIFFRMQRPDLALLEVALLWLSVAALVWVCGRVSRLAGLLLLPYLVWVSVAAFLNWEIVRLNPPFG
jgi:tryptophan-rich sensory protein